MWKYWKRARRWGWEQTELLTGKKIVTSVIVGVVDLILQGGVGLRPWDAIGRFVAVTVAAYVIVSLLSVAINVFFRAPVALDTERGVKEAEGRFQVEQLAPKPRATAHVDQRANNLRRWVAEFANKTGEMRMWLQSAVPATENFNDYVEPLRTWATRAQTDIKIEREHRMVDGRTDVEFIVQQAWWRRA